MFDLAVFFVHYCKDKFQITPNVLLSFFHFENMPADIGGELNATDPDLNASSSSS